MVHGELCQRRRLQCPTKWELITFLICYKISTSRQPSFSNCILDVLWRRSLTMYVCPNANSELWPTLNGYALIELSEFTFLCVADHQCPAAGTPEITKAQVLKDEHAHWQSHVDDTTQTVARSVRKRKTEVTWRPSERSLRQLRTWRYFAAEHLIWGSKLLLSSLLTWLQPSDRNSISCSAFFHLYSRGWSNTKSPTGPTNHNQYLFGSSNGFQLSYCL